MKDKTKHTCVRFGGNEKCLQCDLEYLRLELYFLKRKINNLTTLVKQVINNVS